MKRLMLVIGCLLIGGCCSLDRAATRMTREQVIAAANAKAIEEGLDPSEYVVTGCHYEFTRTDGTWTVFFEMKPPTPPGGHFDVTIEDTTGQSTLTRGE